MNPPKHAPRARRAPFAALVVGLIGGGMCTLLALNTASAANEVARHDIAAKDQSIAAQLVQLENQVQASAAPQNLAAAAAALGMVPAGNPGFLEIGKDGTVRVLGSPAAASVVPLDLPPHARPTPKSPAKSSTAAKTADKTKSTDKTTSSEKTKSTHKTKATDKSTSKQKTARKTTPKAGPTSSGRPTPAKPTPTPTPTMTLPGGTR
jgi:hypothetical protein